MIKNIYNFFKSHALAVLGVLGFVWAVIFTLTIGSSAKPKAGQLSEPSHKPFASAIAATGLIESSSNNIKISPSDYGVIEKLFVVEGQKVKKGDPLFRIDTRIAKEDILLKKTAVDAAKAQVSIESVNEKIMLDSWKRSSLLQTNTVIAESLKTQKKLNYDKAVASLSLAKAQLKQSEAELSFAKAILDRLYVKAPIDGLILKIYVREGEAIQSNSQSYALLMGAIKPLYLRVQIDENDMMRFSKDSVAKAFLKGSHDLSFDLKLVRVEPYAYGKQNLNGNSKQIIDTRVVEVIYEITNPQDNLIIGQQMDVYANYTKKTSQ